MTKWISITERLPDYGNTVLVEDAFGSYYRLGFFGLVAETWHERNLIRWLDESQPFFTLKDMMAAYEEGVDVGFRNGFDTFNEFIKSKYNIEI